MAPYDNHNRKDLPVSSLDQLLEKEMKLCFWKRVKGFLESRQPGERLFEIHFSN